MLTTSKAFSGFSVDEIAKNKAFYADVLGLKVTEDGMGGLNIELPGGEMVYVYQKDDHEPATYTTLNFVVSNIDDTVAELKSQGVEFEQYSGMTDDDGIARGIANNRGPDIAWFKDPAGNIFSVLQSD